MKLKEKAQRQRLQRLVVGPAIKSTGSYVLITLMIADATKALVAGPAIKSTRSYVSIILMILQSSFMIGSKIGTIKNLRLPLTMGQRPHATPREVRVRRVRR